jgi:hypothetical protein
LTYFFFEIEHSAGAPTKIAPAYLFADFQSLGALAKSSKFLANVWYHLYNSSIMCRCQLDGHIYIRCWISYRELLRIHYYTRIFNYLNVIIVNKQSLVKLIQGIHFSSEIKVLKNKYLNCSIVSVKLTYDEFYSLMVQIKAYLNSWPIIINDSYHVTYPSLLLTHNVKITFRILTLTLILFFRKPEPEPEPFNAIIKNRNYKN